MNSRLVHGYPPGIPWTPWISIWHTMDTIDTDLGFLLQGNEQ